MDRIVTMLLEVRTRFRTEKVFGHAGLADDNAALRPPKCGIVIN
jgi:hypothetical protein